MFFVVQVLLALTLQATLITRYPCFLSKIIYFVYIAREMNRSLKQNTDKRLFTPVIL